MLFIFYSELNALKSFVRQIQNATKYWYFRQFCVKTLKKNYRCVCILEIIDLPFGEMLRDWVMGAVGAGSIFQGAQHDAGENSGVGPLPADINMVEPPSLPGCIHHHNPPKQSDKVPIWQASSTYLTDDTCPARARSKLSQNTEERACRPGAPTPRLLPFARLGKNLLRQTSTKSYLHWIEPPWTSLSNVLNSISERVKITAPLDSCVTFCPVLWFL